MFSKFKELFSTINNIIFSEICIFCNKSSTVGVCENCENKLLKINFPYCLFCGFPLQKNTCNLFCSDCLNHPKRFTFNCCREVYFYRNEFKILIKYFKFKKKKYLAKFLGKILAQYYSNIFSIEDKILKNNEYTDKFTEENKKHIFPAKEKIDFVVAVPPTIFHLRERLFNPPEEIARVFCEITKIPFVNDILYRKNIKITQGRENTWWTRAGFTRNEREKIIRDLFYIKDNLKVKNKIILVIDDLITTGATLNEVARILKKNGAKNVYCICAAATVRGE